MVFCRLLLRLQHVFGSARGSIAKPNDRGVFVCWNNRIKTCAIGICYNNDYSDHDFNRMKQNTSYFSTIPIENDDLIDTGSIIHKSTTEIPTCANDIKLLTAITQSLDGHYTIGKDFAKCSYLKSYEIIHSLLKIIYTEYKHNQTTISPQSECQQPQSGVVDQSTPQIVHELQQKIQTLHHKIVRQDHRLEIKHKKLVRAMARYNVCFMFC